MFIKKNINTLMRNNFSIIFIGSFLAIIVAYFAQYIGKLEPCSLCIFERIPYLALQCIALVAIICPRMHKVMTYMVIAVGLIEIILALYHVAIEHYIFTESLVCHATGKACSEVAFRFMNLSMALTA